MVYSHKSWNVISRFGCCYQLRAVMQIGVVVQTSYFCTGRLGGILPLADIEGSNMQPPSFLKEPPNCIFVSAREDVAWPSGQGLELEKIAASSPSSAPLMQPRKGEALGRLPTRGTHEVRLNPDMMSAGINGTLINYVPIFKSPNLTKSTSSSIGGSQFQHLASKPEASRCRAHQHTRQDQPGRRP